MNCDGCSERNLGFSGYNDDDATFAKTAMATPTETAEPRSNRQITSDINRNPLKNPQTTSAADNSAVQQRISGSRNGKYDHSASRPAETKARERLDENYTDNRHGTPSQVLLLFISSTSFCQFKRLIC